MRAICTDHDESHEWDLQKPLEDYEEGPRCSKCGNTDPEIIEEGDGDEALVPRAFRRFQEGDSPFDLVVEGVVTDPEEARRLREQFNDLAEGEFYLLTEEELAERVEAAQERVREDLREEAEAHVENVRTQAQRREMGFKEEIQRLQSQVAQLQQQAYEQWNIGYESGEEEGYEQGFDEAMNEAEERIDEWREDVEERVEEIRQAAYQQGLKEGREAVEAAREEGYEDGYKSAMEDVEESDEAAIYAAGLNHGVMDGAVQGRKEGLTEGAKLVLEST